MPDIRARCIVTGDEFRITEMEADLIDRVGLGLPWLGEPLPLPKVKPAEFLRQLFSYGNLLFLARQKSVLSGAPVISRYAPSDGRKVVTTEEFWSDRVDNEQFGREYDFTKPFFTQFDALLRDVYYLPLSRSNTENSEFSNGAQNAKNCYLCFSVVESQDCLYCLSQYSGHNNLDCVGSFTSQFCFSCRDIDSCYECQHCGDCWSCQNCFGCESCRASTHLIGCVGLERAEYCIFNQQYSRDEYFRAVEALGLASWAGRTAALNRCEQFIATQSYEPLRMVGAEDSSGQYIRHSSKAHQSYHVINSERCGHMILSVGSRECWKGWASRSERCYASGVMDGQNIIYSYNTWGGESVAYSYFLYNNCSHCFGCAMLKGKSYSILNRSYTKDEYFELVPRIVQHMKETGEWGNYFPPKLSPHSYHASWAKQFIADLPDTELLRRGYRVEQPGELFPTEGGLHADELPDLLREDEYDRYSTAVIRCGESNHSFNLQRAEVEFYKRFSIPLPRRHWRSRLNSLIRSRLMMTDDLDVGRVA